MSKQDYTARCHCGKVRYSFRCEEITLGKRCNCSICVRKGTILSSPYIPAEDFTPPTDLTLLSDYRWNDRVVGHLFCKTCGIYPYHGSSEYGYRVNLGCVDGLDSLSLPIELIDGKSLELNRDPGPHPGDGQP